jgi:AcrR family transcriptional regulator
VPRTGRRPGASGSREKILAVARAQFARDGYDGATLRGIAAAAKVDPALVLHYFGSKEHLFVAALEFPLDPAEVVPRLLAPGLDGLGERMVMFFLEAWDAPDGRPFIGLLRSIAANERAAEMMRQFIAREVIGRVAASLKLDQPELRAALAGSQLVGIAVLRYVIRLEPIASADPAVLAQRVGPAIQRYFTE